MYIGRRKILSDESEITAANVASVLEDSLMQHIQNSAEIDYLYRYYKGDQPIRDRVKTIRPEINNVIVENRANEIVSFKTGYLCGEPLQYVSRGSVSSPDDVIKLNDMMLLCGKPALDKELAEWMYICGAGYRMVATNDAYIEHGVVSRILRGVSRFPDDEAPFNIHTLDPRYTYIVYHSGLGEPPVMAVKYVKRVDRSIVYSVYTPTAYYELASNEFYKEFSRPKTSLRTFNQIPIIEYPLNNSRLGVFEIVLEILDAINNVQSNRIDGVEQFIQAITVLYNCDIDEDSAKYLKEAGLIKLRSVGMEKADIKEMVNELDQMQTQTLVDYMYQTVLNIVGMPNRNGGTSTSDTGSAVVMRDGWEAAESRAKCDELMFKESERKFLKIILQMIRQTVGTALQLSDIETKFTRRNYENALIKSQVLTSMLANPKIAPILAFTHCGMFSDPEDAWKQSEKYYNEQMEAMAQQTNTLTNQENKPPGGGDAVA